MAKEKPEQDLPVDNSKKSPNISYDKITDNKYWKVELTNSDFLYKRYRDGIGKKILTKIKSDMLKNGFDLNNDSYQALREEYCMDQISAYAWDSAATLGYALIYVGYPDVKDINDYKNHCLNRIRF